MPARKRRSPAQKAAEDRRHDAYVCRTYGLQPGDYQRLYEAQGGKCYICQRATGKTKRLAVDHDHKTGRVRGLVCATDNKLLGHARDDKNFFIRGYEYVVNPPAWRLGIVAVHKDNRNQRPLANTSEDGGIQDGSWQDSDS